MHIKIIYTQILMTSMFTYMLKFVWKKAKEKNDKKHSTCFFTCVFTESNQKYLKLKKGETWIIVL